MKRPLTLVGFILATVFLGIDTILELISLPTLLNVINSGYASSAMGVIILTFVLIVFIILALIFNIICIPKWSLSVGAFAGKKGFIITTIVFNFIIVGLVLISFIIGAITVMAILLLLTLTTANILILVDMAAEKNRVIAAAQSEANE